MPPRPASPNPEAASLWHAVPLTQRLGLIGRLRRRLAAEPARLLGCCDWQRPPCETITAEILPLAEAARFLEREAAGILAPRTPPGRRPLWLAGVRSTIVREPRGTVLILAPGNYPLFLPGAQALQALAAGNAVCVKPAPGRAAPMRALAAMLRDSGLPDGVLHILDDSHAAGEAAVRAGFDLIVLTGSADTGRTVLAAAAERLTPCIVELSGNDPVFVLDGADLDLVAAALAYGMTLNAGATCIAPRRVFVPAGQAAELERRLQARLAERPAIPFAPEVRARLARFMPAIGSEAGPRVLAGDAAVGPLVLADMPADAAMHSVDLFAPVLSLIPLPDMAAAVAAAAASPYALGAAVFGPVADARAFALRVNAGSVVVNDLIVPTADPRLPFGGRGASGYGVTRGAEGLLAMTVLKTVSIRRGRFRPHLAPAAPGDAARMAALLRAVHGAGRDRLRALRDLLRRG